MKRKYIIVEFQLFAAVISILVAGCNNQVNSNKELEDLKRDLFKRSADVSELPIYADPPTSDYEEVKNGQFSFQIDSIEIEKIKKYRNELEPIIIQYIDSGYAWVYLAAFLQYESAVPKIKEKLLKCDKFYGWEGGDYQSIERYLEDGQYCYQMAYISAIEYITGKPYSKAVKLTDQEIDSLKGIASKCIESNKDPEAYCWARWLLKKSLIETIGPEVESELDIKKFIGLTESLLTEIQGRPINLTYETETITANKTDEGNIYISLFPSTSKVIRRFTFDPAKGNKALRIWMIEATYKDSISTNKAFEQLQAQSLKTGDINDHLPGLTYTNDYVIKSSKKIYWLNSGCTYSFANHQKLTRFMLQSLRVNNIQDSIWCRCGQLKCSL